MQACGYMPLSSNKNEETPSEFKVMARKMGDMPESDKKMIYDIFNSTIDSFLKSYKKKEDE